MDIGWFRDLVIVILGIVAVGVLVFVSVLLYSLYRRIKPILDAIKTTSRTVEGICSSWGEGLMKPLIQVVAVVQGIRQGIDTVSKLFGKKGGGHDR